MFSIFSERELKNYAQEHPLDEAALISIGDPGQETPDFLAGQRRLLRLEFFDLGESEPEHGMERIPEMEDVDRCIDFYQAHKELNFVIHCDAGISRSPAVGLGLLFLKLGSEDAARTELVSIRPRAMPNKRLVLLFDHVLGSDLRMSNYYIWMKRIEQMKKSISEYTHTGRPSQA